MPRLVVPAAPIALRPLAGTGQEVRSSVALAPPQPRNGASHAPQVGREPSPQLERQRRPGAIVLAARARLSLPRIFKLEQDIVRVAEAADVALDVLENGQIVVYVPPRAEARVRQFLILNDELIQEAADGQ